MEKFYITTTLPYVNAKPHVGHILEFIQADVIARYQAFSGKEVIFNIGTDEHGQKVYQKAIENGKNPQEYVDEMVEAFRTVKEDFNISYTNFIRTTEPHHIEAAKKFWKLCADNGDIYKKNYKVKYCVGCELEKTDSELENGLCPLHPNMKLEDREEENYFFKFSKYEKPLLDLYENHPEFVLPASRFNEIKTFVKDGLTDFSVSRLKEKLPWGIPVPDDDRQVMYVWFDALINYISTLGWPEDEQNFNNFWPGVQIAGKDNLRQQSAMWQAMLLSAGLSNSRQILIHGFVTVDGEKMSKSTGNIIDPLELVKKYGIDTVRYFLLREIPSTEDGDFSYKKLEDRYNGDLANNLGNLVSRVAKLIETRLEGELNYEGRFLDKDEYKIEQTVNDAWKNYRRRIDEFKLHEALGDIWTLLTFANSYIDSKKPWADVTEHPDHFMKTMTSLIYILVNAGWLLEPFMPETANKIFNALGLDRDSKTLEGAKFMVTKIEPLFPRLK